MENMYENEDNFQMDSFDIDDEKKRKQTEQSVKVERGEEETKSGK